MTEGAVRGIRRRRDVLVAYGTRPEIVKLSPVVRALRRAGHRVRVVNTGQHDSFAMSAAIAHELELVADVELHLPEEREARLGALMEGAVRQVGASAAEVVLCLGDTESVLAYALAARRAGVAFWHLEAGLRSFNERSVEELNRRVATAAASLNLAPTERARGFLLAEGVEERRIVVVGNPIIDVLAERGLDKVPLTERRGVLLTAHRATNVDDPLRLRRIVEIANALGESAGQVVFPLHPRTAVMLERSGFAGELHESVRTCEPLGFGAFLEVLRHSALAVTDSGGVQEEAAYFGIPVVVLRGSTPRWEGVDNGSVALVNLQNQEAVDEVRARALAFSDEGERRRIDALACPYGDGATSARVAELLSRPSSDDLLRLGEPGIRVPAPRPQ